MKKRRNRAALQCVRLLLLLCRHDLSNARDALLQDALNAICQGHLRHGATLASALQLNGDHAIVAHIDERNIAAISLKGSTDKFEHCSYIGFFYHDSLLNCFDSSRLFG